MKTKSILTDENRLFILKNHKSMFVRDIAEILEVEELVVRNFVKCKKLKVLRLPYVPKAKRTYDINGIFNVDFYKGEYSWIV